MSRTDKIILSIIGATALPILIGLLLLISPRGPAIRNQAKVVRLLTGAHPEFTAAGSRQIERIALGNGITLMPEREQIAVGYTLQAHVQSSNFTIEAQPVKVGRNGLFSYFRDETGAIRFETGEKRANVPKPSIRPVFALRRASSSAIDVDTLLALC
jgi:hypothetical protein